jgi:long-chain acyl-CoA synthetase
MSPETGPSTAPPTTLPTLTANLAGNLLTSAARFPERPALRHGDIAVSYAELEDASARVADLLHERGMRAGDRVALMLPNVPQFVYAYYGILRAGGVVVPMNVLLKTREIGFCLADSGAVLLLAWHEIAGFADDGAGRPGAETVAIHPGAFEERLGAAPAPEYRIAPRAADDTAVILYTSGTTGTPKGAELTHANLARNAEVTAELLSITWQDVVLGALPLFHAFGQTCCLNASVLVGASLTLLVRFDSTRALDLIGRDRVTVLEAVPTMYAALLDDPRRGEFDCSALRLCVSGGAALAVEVLCVSGGAALAVEVLRGFEAAFECVVLEGYGLSETSPVACFNHTDRERLPGSIGTPVAGVEMRILDATDGVGEIAIRGHNVMKGYWNRPAATAEVIDADGWFRTGDIGRIDAAGRYYVVDRKKDLIIRGGYNVYPREVEEVIYEHPAVSEAAVIGLPHRELGEEVCAVVALKAGAVAEDGELKAFVRERVAAYKYPRHVWIVDALPKTSTGKILKREIRIPDDVLNEGSS